MLAAANIQLGHLELPQQQPADAADKAAVGAAPGPAGADGSAELSSGPKWDWSADESLLLPLSHYEVVESVLRSCKPPLLGRGGAIPLATLAAFRYGVR